MVAGSNPASPTSNISHLGAMSEWLFLFVPLFGRPLVAFFPAVPIVLDLLRRKGSGSSFHTS